MVAAIAAQTGVSPELRQSENITYNLCAVVMARSQNALVAATVRFPAVIAFVPAGVRVHRFLVYRCDGW